ncbi:MAG: hypothetical protein M1320_00910 [Patescibacteria group bacterium]|nr:hypothetical protein [Patescibacteria group bacterium]
MNGEHFKDNSSEQKDQLTVTKEKILEIFKGGTSSRPESIRRYVDILAELNPEFLDSVLSATSDLREASHKVAQRAEKRLADNHVSLVEDFSYGVGGLSTPEGKKLSKLDAPDFFTNPDGYEKFMQDQKDKTPYRGLNEKQSQALLQSMFEFGDATLYSNEAKNIINSLLLEKSVAEQNKEQFGEIFHGLQYISIPFNIMKGEISGKLAKLKYAPKFTADTVKELGQKISQLFKSEEDDSESEED